MKDLLLRASGHARRSAGILGAAIAAAALLISAPTPSHASIPLFGMDLAWLGGAYPGNTFTGQSNAAYQSVLQTFKNNHCNFCRVWVCTGLQGVSMNGDDCTGVSQTVINNVVSFAKDAQALGITVEFVMLNSNDIKNHPGIITNTNYGWDMIEHCFVPIVTQLQGYTCQFDLINEGNYATGGSGITWTNLKTFVNNARWGLNTQNGNTKWITMSDSGYTDFLNNFSGSIGSLPLDYFEYHMYNDQGWCPVTSAITGGKPIELNEFGSGTPAEGWAHNSETFNHTLLNNFMTNAQAAGYYCAAPWTYENDGDFQMYNLPMMADISYLGQQLGH